MTDSEKKPATAPAWFTKIDRERCIACGLCALHAPALYDYDDLGVAYGKRDSNTGTAPIPADQLAAFKTAYRDCPVQAILRRQQPFPPTAKQPVRPPHYTD